MDFASLSIKVNSKDVKQASDDLGTFSNKSTLATKALRNLGPILTTIASGKALLSLANQALDFGAAMGEVNTLLADNTDMPRLTKEAKSLAAQFGGSPTAQARAFYQAISAGASNAEEATNLLTAANKLAIGGVTDITTAVDGLTSVTNAYSLDAKQAERVSDAFFVAMRAGKTTVGELSSSIGKVAATAATAGLSFEETLGSISALTTQGIATSEAVTGLKAALSNILKPSKAAADAAEELGVNFSLSGLQSKGLAGFLDELVEATGGSEEKMLDLFGSTEALNTVFALTGGAAETFDGIMSDMANSAGQTDAAFTKISNTMSQKLSVLSGKFKATGVELGEFILKASTPFVDHLNANFDNYVAYFKALGTATTTALNGLIEIWAPWANKIGELALNAFHYIANLFGPFLSNWVELVEKLYTAIGNFFVAYVTGAEVAIEKVLNFFRNGFIDIRQFVETTRVRIVSFYDSIIAKAKSFFESSETTEAALAEIDRQRAESLDAISTRYDSQREQQIAFNEQADITSGIISSLGASVDTVASAFSGLSTNITTTETEATSLNTAGSNLATQLDNIDTGLTNVDTTASELSAPNGALTSTSDAMATLEESTDGATEAMTGPQGLTVAQTAFQTAIENTQTAWATLIKDTITKGKTDFGGFFDTIKGGFATMVSEIAAQNLTNAIFGGGGLQGFLQSLTNGFGSIIGSIANGLGGLVDTLTGGLTSGITNAIASAIGSVTGTSVGATVGGTAAGAAAGGGFGATLTGAVTSAITAGGGFLSGLMGTAVGASSTLVGPPTAAAAAGMNIAAGFKAIGSTLVGGAQSLIGLATSPVGIAILAAAAIAKILDSGGTPTSKGGFLNYLVPGAPAGSTFDIAPFASGFAPVGFSEIMDRSEALTYIDAFRAVDSELTAFAKSQGLQVALNSNDFGGYNTEGEGGPNAGVFWGLAREKGRMGTALNTQLEEYTNDWLIAVAGKNQVPKNILDEVLESNKVADFVAGITSQRMGLNDVPVDNMVARLHRGERVLTAGQADMTDQLAEEMKVMRSDFNQLMFTVAKATTRTARIEDRWDKNGLPPTRT